MEPIGWCARYSSTEVHRDRRRRSTGAEGEVPQAPSNRNEVSHEGEEHLVRHPPSHPSTAEVRSGDGVENLGGDRFDLAPVGIDREIGDLEVQRFAVGGEAIEYRALVTGFEQRPFAAAAGAF